MLHKPELSILRCRECNHNIGYRLAFDFPDPRDIVSDFVCHDCLMSELEVYDLFQFSWAEEFKILMRHFLISKLKIRSQKFRQNVRLNIYRLKNGELGEKEKDHI